MKKVISLWAIGLVSISVLTGQNDYSLLYPVEAGYRKLMREASDQNRPLLAILYSDRFMANTVLKLEATEELIHARDSMITTVIDWSRKSNHRLVRRENVRTNPSYLMIHHEGTVLLRNPGISNQEQFLEFVRQGTALFFRLEAILNRYEQDDQIETLKELIAFYNKVKDIEKVEESIEEYLKQMRGIISRGDLEYLFAVGKQCLCSESLYEVFDENKTALSDFVGQDELIEYKQGYIINELSKNDLLNPPNVWQWYEVEFGAQADSLYRLFAISYFRHVEPDTEILLDEIYEFLYYYKGTPWEKQDELFQIALNLSTDKDDLELLLDLVSYHYFKQKTYRNTDFRAAILYKLGQEDRALGMVEEVMAMALKEGIRYKSLLHELAKD